MRSRLPKLLHPLCGRPMIAWSVAAASGSGAGRVVVVEGPDRALEEGRLEGGVEFAIQEQPRGTGDAVRSAAAHFDGAGSVIVINGDHPLISPTRSADSRKRTSGPGAAATIATAVLDDPSGYGRVVRGPDGTVERVVETKAPGDASARAARASARSMSRIFAFEPAPSCSRHSRRVSQPDTLRASCICPTCLPILRQATSAPSSRPTSSI